MKTNTKNKDDSEITKITTIYFSEEAKKKAAMVVKKINEMTDNLNKKYGYNFRKF